MKANRRWPNPLVTLGVLALGVLAACSERRVIPPAPAPTATPVPRPLPRPVIDWRAAPLTPGDWSWAMESGQSTARFAGGLLVLRCDRTAGKVTLLRAGLAQTTVPMTIMTSAMTRNLSGTPQAEPPMIVASFPARDPLLDAMAFSRGRFALEVAGLTPLVVPSWTEVSRVIEDCR